MNAAEKRLLDLARQAEEGHLSAVRGAVRDRVLNSADLARLTDPALVFGDSTELRAQAVARQREDMNRYWRKETGRFRDDVARTVREAARRGLEVDRVADLLQERLDVSRSRAVLIAQDQVLTAAATAERQLLQAAGVRRFQWRALMDNRTRPDRQAERCRCRAVVPPPEPD